MPVYVYACKDKTHPRMQFEHGIREDPVILCLKCKQRMHRVPQPFRFGMSATDVLYEHMDKKYREWRTRRRKGQIR